MVEITLKTSLRMLGADNQFIQQSERLGIVNLGDMLHVNLDKLKKHQEFTYTWYATMLELLKEQNLLNQFQKSNL